MDCYVWYSDERTGRISSPPRPILAVPNVTLLPSTASVPITELLCGFSAPIKGLTSWLLSKISDVRLNKCVTNFVVAPNVWPNVLLGLWNKSKSAAV